jgi:tetratricopeptide (TPR) repeat protein
MGRGHDAADKWRTALKIAKETGDRALAAYALTNWSYLASSRNDIAPAIRLLRKAEDYVPGCSAPTTRSWIAAREAEELSRLGDNTGALRALERAFTAFDFARPRIERVWTEFFTAARLGGLTVSTYMTLNHPDTTAAADSLLAPYPPSTTKPAPSPSPISQSWPPEHTTSTAPTLSSTRHSMSKYGPGPASPNNDS